MTAAQTVAASVLDQPRGDDFIGREEVSAVLPLPSAVSTLLAGPVMRTLGLHRINQLYRSLSAHEDPREFLRGFLNAMQIEVVTSPGDLEQVPRTGPVVVTANHPFGGLDGIALASLLTRVRPDVKVLANYLLRRIRPLRELFIFVNPFDATGAARENVIGLRRAMQWLEEDGMLVAFPAGEVAHWSARAGRVVDAPWSETVAGLVRRARATILPVHIAGRNSTLFHLAGAIHPILRTALLPRELMNKSGRAVRVAIGRPVPHERLHPPGCDVDAMPYARARVELLGHRDDDHARRVIGSIHRKIVRPTPRDRLTHEVSALPAQQLLLSSGTWSVYEAGAEQIPSLLREIGRLREITFRAAGEGTGRSIDIDRFDQNYRHLFIWHTQAHEIVGAYRLAPAHRLLRRGIHALYASSLFRFSPGFFDAVGPAIELGRSFVRQEYQRSYSPLLLLWKGIGAWLRRHPECETLYGAVSVSRAYCDASRALIREYLSHHHAREDLAGLVRPRHPFRPARQLRLDVQRLAERIHSADELSAWVSDLEPDRKGIPVLLRQYLRLGGRVAASNVDPLFNNALDILIVIDLSTASSGFVRRCVREPGVSHGVSECTLHAPTCPDR